MEKNPMYDLTKLHVRKKKNSLHMDFVWKWPQIDRPHVHVSGASQGCQALPPPSLSHYLRALWLYATPMRDLWGKISDIVVFPGVFWTNSLFI